MVLLTMTPAIVAGLQKVQEDRGISNPPANADVEDTASRGTEEDANTAPQAEKDDAQHQEPSLENPKSGNPISHLQVLNLSHKLKALHATPCHLDALLRGSYVYIPPPPPKPEPTSEYKALMARLRREAEAREYSKLVANPTHPAGAHAKNLPGTSPAFAFASTEAYIEPSPDDDITYADVNRQLTLIFNVLVSIVACAAALWMVSRWWNTPARLALSMGGSIVVAIAEVGIYFGYIRRIKEAVEEERGVEEVKEVVDSWVVGTEGKDKPMPNKNLTPRKGKGQNEAVRRRKKTKKTGE